ncbi:193_t:CDS:2, partial [Funneliformis caledonium]
MPMIDSILNRRKMTIVLDIYIDNSSPHHHLLFEEQDVKKE